MTDPDLGGDPACWAHLLDEDHDERVRPVLDPDGAAGEAVVVDLGSAAHGSGGAIWSLPHGGDLDANLVRLDPGAGIGEHVNDHVDVLVFVQSGSGHLTIDHTSHQLGPDHVALIPTGARRTVVAGPRGITYLSVHRRRGPLGITKRPTVGSTEEGSHL